jgi:hypothetical protein
MDDNTLTPAQAARALCFIMRSRWKYSEDLEELADWFFECLAAIGGAPDPRPEDALGISAMGSGTVSVARINLADCLLNAAQSDTLPIHFPSAQDLKDFLYVLELYINEQQEASR